ncbi:MAG: rane protein, partial [Aeromicrobium sp.]|nr:rane protein [Aeromicrobium sp.]
YLLIAVPITIWVAATLSRNGRVFLIDVFGSDGALADAVNRLLVVGFYLLNLGFVMLYLRGGGEVADLTGLVETLSVKIGVVMLVLGVLHFVNVMVFSSMRRHGRAEALRAHAPQPPQGFAGYPYTAYPAQPPR